MPTNLAEKFATNPHRWLIVTGVTFVLALLIVLPQVDELLEVRAEHDGLTARMDAAKQAVAILPQLESRVRELHEQASALQEQEVDQQRVSDLRKWLVETARQTGCNLRKADFGRPSVRRWHADDTPLGSSPVVGTSGPTPFDLETHTVTLTITGAPYEVREIMQEFDADRRIKHVQMAGLKPIGRGGGVVQLDLTIWYFALTETKQSA